MSLYPDPDPDAASDPDGATSEHFGGPPADADAVAVAATEGAEAVGAGPPCERIDGVATASQRATELYGVGLQPGSAASGPTMSSATSGAVLQLVALSRSRLATNGGHSAGRRQRGRSDGTVEGRLTFEVAEYGGVALRDGGLEHGLLPPVDEIGVEAKTGVVAGGEDFEERHWDQHWLIRTKGTNGSHPNSLHQRRKETCQRQRPTH